MTIDVACPGKILAYLTSFVSTFNTFEAFFPFDLREASLAIQVRFEAFREL